MTAEPPELTDEQIRHYRQVLQEHAKTQPHSTCPTCGVPRCADWTTAYDRLAAAGQAMTDEPLWEPYVGRGARK